MVIYTNFRTGDAFESEERKTKGIQRVGQVGQFGRIGQTQPHTDIHGLARTAKPI
jgi:hypothetical protein